MDLAQANPNLNAEVYRNMTAADRPPVFDTHLQFILVFDDDNAILGASNMTDRYWSGTVSVYNNCTNFDKEDIFVASKTESGVCDGAYLGDRDKFAIVEDSGVLQIFKLAIMADTEAPELRCAGYACQHDDSINALSVFHSNSHLVTGGMDYCIKVWDAAELLASHNYCPAHTDIVTCVDTQPKSDSIFLSTSLDREALMWDIRKSNPAQRIFRKDICGLTAVAWSPYDENVVAIGAADGSVTLVDVRKPDEVASESIVFTRGVHRLLFHPQRPHYMAGCCDSTSVKVLDTSKELTVTYEDNRHKDFVRGLAWYNDELLTCSWDDTVLRHSALA